ncbi:hypothetical protein [Chengkuizengella marina]|uniref:hypothetical protein n=1 Tax=Chengkuizengella marina TaxID=2507566 RepID=UPI00136C61EB|nr:hypothetical protein [Chengkuizengella marina]
MNVSIEEMEVILDAIMDSIIKGDEVPKRRKDDYAALMSRIIFEKSWQETTKKEP